MPGQQKRKKVVAELQRLAEAAEVETPLEYVVLMLESGETMLDVCSRLSLAISERVYSGAIQRLLIDEAGSMETLTQRLNEARKRGAATMAEEAKSITDDCDPTPGAVAKARAQGDARARLAEAWDRERFGSKAATGLTLNIGALHGLLPEAESVRALG